MIYKGNPLTFSKVAAADKEGKGFVIAGYSLMPDGSIVIASRSELRGKELSDAKAVPLRAIMYALIQLSCAENEAYDMPVRNQVMSEDTINEIVSLMP